MLRNSQQGTIMSESSKETRKSLVIKLCEVMAEVGKVPKRGRNEFHKYDYVMEGDLAEAARQKLAAHKVMMIPDVESHTRNGELVDTVMVKFTFHYDEAGETIRFHMPGHGCGEGHK